MSGDIIYLPPRQLVRTEQRLFTAEDRMVAAAIHELAPLIAESELRATQYTERRLQEEVATLTARLERLEALVSMDDAIDQALSALEEDEVTA